MTNGQEKGHPYWLKRKSKYWEILENSSRRAYSFLTSATYMTKIWNLSQRTIPFSFSWLSLENRHYFSETHIKSHEKESLICLVSYLIKKFSLGRSSNTFVAWFEQLILQCINAILLSAPFLYPLKTSENLTLQKTCLMQQLKLWTHNHLKSAI